jgi:multiple antibiotic resistance protein
MNLLASIVGATLLVAAALFPIVNPLGSSLIFLGLTGGYSPEIRRSLVRRISVNSFLLLLVSMLIGTRVLEFFGVSLPVVQVAGGLVVIAMGWNMLQQNDSDPQRGGSLNDDQASQQAFYPLTLPITVGPGSISVAVALGANTYRQAYPWPAQLASSFLGPLIIAISIYICYRSAERLEKILGRTGLSVFIRLSAFIVLCIGIQILWNGLSALAHLH